ncbi:hypothetical protein ACA910_021312 [Epithemia clementina (nom. ined.)]
MHQPKNLSLYHQQLVLISGSSGTGKTKLAQSLQRPTTKAHGLFVQGKFDEPSSSSGAKNQPYSLRKLVPKSAKQS